ncbi:uncharacterized protein PSFLO_06740 [Pseudozyma flocculosa]|uniref:Uncharacterized protein n=1 Tax=Pseudozyma flocculosa TaxID=84751 RepID=A0A5C3F9X8_9BASI|nr:uncharacterized protein PSFLO_06740 [Pseudozyma flocculosa]
MGSSVIVPAETGVRGDDHEHPPQPTYVCCIQPAVPCLPAVTERNAARRSRAYSQINSAADGFLGIFGFPLDPPCCLLLACLLARRRAALPRAVRGRPTSAVGPGGVDDGETRTPLYAALSQRLTARLRGYGTSAASRRLSPASLVDMHLDRRSLNDTCLPPTTSADATVSIPVYVSRSVDHRAHRPGRDRMALRCQAALSARRRVTAARRRLSTDTPRFDWRHMRRGSQPLCEPIAPVARWYVPCRTGQRWKAVLSFAPVGPAPQKSPVLPSFQRSRCTCQQSRPCSSRPGRLCCDTKHAGVTNGVAARRSPTYSMLNSVEGALHARRPPGLFGYVLPIPSIDRQHKGRDRGSKDSVLPYLPRCRRDRSPSIQPMMMSRSEHAKKRGTGRRCLSRRWTPRRPPPAVWPPLVARSHRVTGGRLKHARSNPRINVDEGERKRQAMPWRKGERNPRQKDEARHCEPNG